MSIKDTLTSLNKYVSFQGIYLSVIDEFITKKDNVYGCKKCAPKAPRFIPERVALNVAFKQFCACFWDNYRPGVLYLYPAKVSNSYRRDFLSFNDVEKIISVFQRVEDFKPLPDVDADLTDLKFFERNTLKQISSFGFKFSDRVEDAFRKLVAKYRQFFEDNPDKLREAILGSFAPKVDKDSDDYREVLSLLRRSQGLALCDPETNIKVDLLVAELFNEVNALATKEFTPLASSHVRYLVDGSHLYSSAWDLVLSISEGSSVMVVPEVFLKRFPALDRTYRFRLRKDFVLTGEFVEVFNGIYQRYTHGPCSTVSGAARAALQLMK